MIYKNGNVFLNGEFKKADIYVEDRRIKDIVLKNSGFDAVLLEGKLMEGSYSHVIDCTDKYIIPGLVDIHTHACVGCDFSMATKESLKKMTEYYYNEGISTVLATTMTYDRNELLKAAKEIGSFVPEENNAEIAGIYMEGPFFGEAQKGAHDPKYLSDVDLDFLEELDASSGHKIKVVAFDPLLPNAYNLARQYKDRFTLSIAHTACDYEVASDYMALGINHVTHTFNAMNAFDKRSPGVVGAALDNEDCYTELICDGIHIHPSVIRMMFKCHGSKMVLISDSMGATGLKDGIYSLGGQEVFVKDRKATLANGTIAGSATNLCEMLKNVISFGVDPVLAVAAATINPAKSVGIDGQCGVIEVGRKADFLVADKDFSDIRRI